MSPFLTGERVVYIPSSLYLGISHSSGSQHTQKRERIKEGRERQKGRNISNNRDISGITGIFSGSRPQRYHNITADARFLAAKCWLLLVMRGGGSWSFPAATSREKGTRRFRGNVCDLECREAKKLTRGKGVRYGV